jgi:anaphase-promoting complex subunit 10
LDTYWQSHGPLPHLINILFQKRTHVSKIYLYVDYKLDESYTPSHIVIRSGTHFNDLVDVTGVDLQQPSGWIGVPVKSRRGKPLKVFLLQIAVIKNHESGRDTHIRQVKIHQQATNNKKRMLTLDDYTYSTVEFSQFRTIR